MTDTYIPRPYPYSQTKRYDPKTNISDCAGIRFYPASPHGANLQIRTTGKLTFNSKECPCISTAWLDVAAAKQLRNALDEWIDSQESAL